MLGEFPSHRRIFVEVTKTVHGHGGAGWEFGTCLWSPARNKAGHDIYRLMRETQAGDLVLHILENQWEPGSPPENRFAGRSFVAAPCETNDDGPPSPGDWVNQAPYYRVALRGYESLPRSISLETFIGLFGQELRQDLKTRPVYYPFTLYGGGTQVRLRQGGYINECTPALFTALQMLIGEHPVPGSQVVADDVPPPSADREFKETKRLAGERYAFARNPSLVREARRLRGYICEACDFNFQTKYGDLGKEYIECHHVDPLGHRDHPTTATRVRDVRMLCANCHRMAHRRRPPIPVEELRAQLGLAPLPPLHTD